MLIVPDLDVTVDYSLKSDISEPKVIFELGLLDSYEAAHIQSLIATEHRTLESKDEVDFTEVIFTTVKLGLKGVRNFPVPIRKEELNIPKVGKRQVIAESFLRLLKLEWIVELYGELLSRNFLTEEIKKKLDTPSE